MENLLTRHRNVTILVVVLFAEVVGLAVQVKRTNDTDSSRLLRLWTVSAVTPVEKAFAAGQEGISGVWHNYFYLRGLRSKNRELQDEIEQLRLQQVRLAEDAGQARRLQRLLGFKEQFIAKTLAAQVIGSSGSDMSRVVYIDKGSGEGVQPDMAVITADGVVGKVLRVFPASSQVLLINDPSSGVGAILEKSRLQGVIKGTADGRLVLEKMMSDERVEPGDRLLTSGGDQIFPKGLPIGTVKSVSPGRDVFLDIRVKPAAQLSQLEEVLVITQVVEREPSPHEAETSMRAVDILAARLPSVPQNTGLPSTGVPLPVGVRPPVAKKPGELAAAPGSKPALPGAGTGVTPKHIQPAGATTAQFHGEPGKKPAEKPKSVGGANGAASPSTTAARKPRLARPAMTTGTAVKQPGSDTSGSGNSAAAAPEVSAPPKKPSAAAPPNPPSSTPQGETPQP